MPLFQYLFEVSFQAPLQACYRAVPARGRSREHSAAWLQHGVNTAAMGTSARQLRTAPACGLATQASALLNSRPNRLALGHIAAPPFPD
jgi:hypothetical protein